MSPLAAFGLGMFTATMVIAIASWIRQRWQRTSELLEFRTADSKLIDSQVSDMNRRAWTAAELQAARAFIRSQPDGGHPRYERKQ